VADYSALDKLLHRLALGSPALAETMHDIERGMFLKTAPADDGRHVFVAGLARAGTTILMREIHRTGEFGSLTYADMPFVLAPNLWAGISGKGRTAGVRRERAHGDGIEVDFDSPEALDEAFWRVFDGDSYIGADALIPHRPDAVLIDRYRDLIRLALRRTGKARYLSKNNNNILRLGALAPAMPAAVFLIALRQPLPHAASLLAQHQRFLAADRFTCQYMTWLGHHEFGATHRPFRFDAPLTGDPMCLDYWLKAWIAAYGALEAAATASPNVVFAPYEALCRDPAVWKAVAARIGVAASPAGELRDRAAAPPGPHDKDLADQAIVLHARLSKRAFDALSLAAR
jgi:hypothetical protein